jgi:Ferredoxin-like domain in Api92-like protein
MPNHVANEVIFTGLTEDLRAQLLMKLCKADGTPDFSILLPPPLNSWPGSVGARHEKAFPHNDLDWNTKNWSTKWNAYRVEKAENEGDRLVLRFNTAWRAPMGWFLAIFNTFKIDFEYRYLDEGASRGRIGEFCWANLDDWLNREAWSERDVDDEMNRYLHVLRWGDAADEIMRSAEE